MAVTKIIRSFIIIFLINVSNPYFLQSNDFDFKLKIGEQLTYKVKWAFIRLGTLKLEIADTLVVDDELLYHVKLYVDSNPLLFFVNMHSVYNSYINKDFQLHRFYSEEKIDDVNYIAEYRIDYSDSLILIKMTDVNDTSKIINKSMPFEKTILDGTSLIFYARKQAFSTKKDTVESFFESERGKVAFNFHGQKKPVKIAALVSPVDCYYIDGKIDTRGIAGVTGRYKGWFASDGQRPPIKGELKVFIGNVKIELEKWENWQPKY